MPNSTVPYLREHDAARVVGEARCEVATVDEYVQTDLEYLDLLRAASRAAGRSWRWSACRATSSIALSTSRRTREAAEPRRSSAVPTR